MVGLPAGIIRPRLADRTSFGQTRGAGRYLFVRGSWRSRIVRPPLRVLPGIAATGAGPPATQRLRHGVQAPTRINGGGSYDEAPRTAADRHFRNAATTTPTRRAVRRSPDTSPTAHTSAVRYAERGLARERDRAPPVDR